MEKIKEILNLDKYTEKQIKIFLFASSCIFTLLITLLITYSFDFTNNFNLLFDSDTSRVIGDMTNIYYNHYRLSVHPLFVLLIEPIVFILKGVLQNDILSVVVLSAITSSISVLFIYNILSLFTNNRNINVLLSYCYLFSFSNIIFTSGVEIYNIAALFLIILWYYTLKKLKENDFNKYSYIILTILGLLSLSFTITNFVVFLIIMFILWISKTIKLKNIILITISSGLLMIILSLFQYLVWHNTPKIWESNLKDEIGYSEKTTIPQKILNVVKDDYYNSILGSKLQVKVLKNYNYQDNNFKLIFNYTNIFNIIVLSVFYLLCGLLLVRNFKKNLFINIGLLLSILFNSILHVIYGNICTFLYSLHFLYLIFIIFGINLATEENKKIIKITSIYLTILLVLELVINAVRFKQLFDIIRSILNSTYYLNNFGLFKTLIIYCFVISIIFISITLIIKLTRKIRKEKTLDKKIIMLISIFFIGILIECVFITLETTKIYNKLLWKEIFTKDNTVQVDNKTKYLDKKFNEVFKDEIKSLNNYIKEYEDFLNTYENEQVGFVNECDFYFFGLGNRKKLLYRNGSIIDIDKRENIYEFDVKDYLIVPNEYTVLIETKDKRFIKIYEDRYGIHLLENKEDKIIEGTEVEIDLYDFSNQKYSNIKKVLYSEILFNIKDGVIYPNILVYDSPWYRDGAITSMVLEQTNNTDLISDWVKNIEEIYDKQNAGNEEPDNLGELLYIISTQDEINYELVDKIEEEANRLAETNPDGYYIYGKTDFGDMYLYQNLWYKLGIERVGRSFNFDTTGIDDGYTKTAWWSSKLDESYDSVSEAYPYLTFAKRHTLGKGKIVVNRNIYPLSWEKDASQADYSKMNIIIKYYENSKISPLHTWSASELLLFLLDETNDLK